MHGFRFLICLFSSSLSGMVVDSINESCVRSRREVLRFIFALVLLDLFVGRHILIIDTDL